MRFKNVMMSSVAALAIVSTSAMAAVTLENDGTGDYLLAPATYANESGWATQLKVVNTNTTHAVIARVVIRNGHDSSELFDFPLYLTPGDAWEGTLKVGTGANSDRIVVETADDSSMIWDGPAGHIVRANVEGPLEITVSNDDPKLDVANTTTGVTDGRRSTYVEVFGLAAYDAATVATAMGTTWAVNTPLDKVKFFEYVRNVTEGTPKTQVTTPGVLNDLYDPDNAIADVDNDSILGKQVIVNEAAKLNMAYNMVALGEVSTAERTVAVIGTPTTMNTMSDKGAAVATPEMDAVLSKDEVYVMNEGTEAGANPMRIHFSDPLKKYYDEANALATRYLYDGSGTLITDYYYTFSQIGHDMEENVTACQSVGGNSDLSNDGFETDDCNSTPVEYEVMQLQAGGTGVDYIFNSGGFLTYDLEQNTSVVPTTFSSSNLGGTYVNYHIGNQYKAGTPNPVNP
jgi:hypothetical protein